MKAGVVNRRTMASLHAGRDLVLSVEVALLASGNPCSYILSVSQGKSFLGLGLSSLSTMGCTSIQVSAVQAEPPHSLFHITWLMKTILRAKIIAFVALQTN